MDRHDLPYEVEEEAESPDDSFTTCLSKAQRRKINKPIMEKRRRDRINRSLSEIKSLVLDSSGDESDVKGCDVIKSGDVRSGDVRSSDVRHSKLEKADILEMAVQHLKTLQHGTRIARQQLMVEYRSGFTDCVSLVRDFLCDSDPGPLTSSHLLSPPPPTSSHLLSYLLTRLPRHPHTPHGTLHLPATSADKTCDNIHQPSTCNPGTTCDPTCHPPSPCDTTTSCHQSTTCDPTSSCDSGSICDPNCHPTSSCDPTRDTTTTSPPPTSLDRRRPFRKRAGVRQEVSATCCRPVKLPALVPLLAPPSLDRCQAAVSPSFTRCQAAVSPSGSLGSYSSSQMSSMSPTSNPDHTCQGEVVWRPWF